MKVFKLITMSIFIIGLLVVANAQVVHADNFIVRQTKSNANLPFCDANGVVIEISHYSENEAVDAGGSQSIGSTGKKLEYGDIAMPYVFPAWTQIALKDGSDNFITGNDGKVIIFTNVDRGNIKCINVFDHPNKNNALMRIDLFLAGASPDEMSHTGLTYYKMVVLRWGKEDISKLISKTEQEQEDNQKRKEICGLQEIKNIKKGITYGYKLYVSSIKNASSISTTRMTKISKHYVMDNITSPYNYVDNRSVIMAYMIAAINAKGFI